MEVPKPKTPDAGPPAIGKSLGKFDKASPQATGTPEPAPEPVRWGWMKRFLFRFSFVYLLLYALPSPFTYVIQLMAFCNGKYKDWTGDAEYAGLWTGKLVEWAGMPITWWMQGKHALAEWAYGLYTSEWSFGFLRFGSFPVGSPGSGDRSINYTHLVLTVVIAALICVIWSALDRRRPNYRQLGKYLVIFARYYLAFIVMGYGTYKIIQSQFPFPGMHKLLHTYGDSSPMGLLWTFMGYSGVYNFFTGFFEWLGGALLLFRQTRALGAVVTISVMSNIVMLNYTYDVPVKLYSSHLLLIAIVLLALDARRMLNVFLLNRPAPPADLSPPWRSTWAVTLAWILKLSLIAFVGYTQFDQVLTGQEMRDKRKAETPYYGLYVVEEFKQDDLIKPPLTTDKTRWGHVFLQSKGYLQARYMDGRRQTFVFEVDKTTNTARFGLPTRPPKKPDTLPWKVENPEPGVLLLSGKFQDKSLSMRLKERPLDSFLLVNREYRWVNEFPYHR